MKTRKITLFINGEKYNLDVTVNRTLLQVLREDLNLVGTKYGCGMGECGACTVIIDDNKTILSCLTLAALMDGKSITTIEGLAKDGALDPVQNAFIEGHAIQCGFCTPGMILKTKSMLAHNPNLTENEINENLEGNICRCTGYVKIVNAVKKAGQTLSAQKSD